MPIARLQPRSALALFLYFPWFPFSPPLPPEAQPQTVAVETGAAGEAQTAASAVEEPLVLPGVVIEEVPKGSALEKAGLQVGDVILSWERLPNPPTNPEGASGKIESPFDWMWLEIEQAPRGMVRLIGERERRIINLQVPVGIWKLKPQPLLLRHQDGARIRASILLDQLEAVDRESNWCIDIHAPALIKNNLLRAWLLTQMGQRLVKNKNWEAAEICYQKAIENVRLPQITLYTWFLIGQLYERSGSADKAAAIYERTAFMASSQAGHELHSAKLLLELESLAYLSGELTKAEDLAQRAHNIHERLAPNSFQFAGSLSELGSIAWKRGDFASAEKLITQALSIRSDQSSGTLFEVESLIDLAVLSRDLGQQDRALSLLEKALSILQTLPPASASRPTAVALGNLGNIALDKGDLRLAEGYNLRLLSAAREDPTGQALTRSALNNLGVISTQRGDLEAAEDYYDKALLISRTTAPNSLDVARVLTNLGGLAKNQGDLEAAFDYHQEALEIKKKLAPDSTTLAASLQNLGAVMREQGRLTEAQSYYTLAWQIRKKHSDSSLDLAASFRDMGYVARDAGNASLARKYFEESLKIQKLQVPGSLELAATLGAIGELLARQGNLHDAIRYHEEALSIRERISPGSFSEASSLFSLAKIHLQLGEKEKSFTLIQRSIKSLQEQAVRVGSLADTQGKFYASVAEIFRFAVHLAVLIKENSWGFSSLEQFRATGFLASLGERDLILTNDIPLELESRRAKLAVEMDRAATSFQLPGTTSKLGSDEDNVTKQRRLEREWNDVARSIRRACPRLASLKYPEPVDISGAQNALDAGTVLLSYLVGEEESILFILSPGDDLRIHTLSTSEKDLRNRIQKFRALIAETRPRTTLWDLRRAELHRLSKELYKLLVAPAADLIEKADRVLVVADGPLHYLSFTALVRETTNEEKHPHAQYLAEWKPFHSALSVTVYSEIKKDRRNPMMAQVDSSVLLGAFGDPQFPPDIGNKKTVQIADMRVRAAIRRGTLSFEQLPYSRHEVEGIAALFPPDQVALFVGAEATEDRAKSIGKGVRIIHFATHARLDDRFPLNSALVLTIPPGLPENRENGLLQVWEVFEKVRLDADLLVLSACDTGLGEEQGGEGLIGLTRAFQYAGARTVMASLWSVQDQATSELMIRFYKHLRAGKTKDEALRQAQIELIRGPIEVVNEKGEKTLIDASAPYYWAGFQVYGDWQ